MLSNLARAGWFIAGSVTALVLLEGGLRVLASPEPPPYPRPARDGLHVPVLDRRQLEEGIADAHFSFGGARLTGNPPIDTGATVVIIGDSHVVAREVADRETMGSLLEQRARLAGRAINVRQYGWRSGNPGQYLRSARDIVDRWHPVETFVLLDDNNLGINAAMFALPRVRLDSAGRLAIIGPSLNDFPQPDEASSLVMLARHRWDDVNRRLPAWARQSSAAVLTKSDSTGDTPPGAAELAALPDAVVRALANAYGPAVSLIYLADVGITGDDAVSDTERRFLSACRSQGVKCVSTRDAMLVARARGEAVRGFSTTTLGSGHLNAAGHRLVANEMWELFAR